MACCSSRAAAAAFSSAAKRKRRSFSATLRAASRSSCMARSIACDASICERSRSICSSRLWIAWLGLGLGLG